MVHEGDFAVVDDFQSGGVSYGPAVIEVGPEMDKVNGWSRFWLKSALYLDDDKVVDYMEQPGLCGIWMNSRDFNRIVPRADVNSALFRYFAKFPHRERSPL